MLIRRNKAKARADARKRVRGGVTRARIGETRTRTVIRATAEQDTTECLCVGDVRVMAIAEICGRTATHQRGHNFAALSADDFLDVSLGSGFVPDVAVSVVSVVLEFRGVFANEHLAETVAAVLGRGADADVDAVCPLIYMSEGVLNASVTWNV